MHGRVLLPTLRLTAALALAHPTFALAHDEEKGGAHTGADSPGAAEAAGEASADGRGAIRGTVTVPSSVEDTIVYLKDVPGEYASKVHPLELRDGRFAPHAIAVAVGDTVKFMNHDGRPHNVVSTDADTYYLGVLEKGEERGHAFMRPGVYSQRCTLHKEFLGYVFVGTNPYAATVDAGGAYVLDDVPPGRYTLGVWNASSKLADATVAVAAGEIAALDISASGAAPATGRATAAIRPARPARRSTTAREAEREAPRSTGTIRGRVEATPAKYLEETVVYLEHVPGSWAPRTHVLDQKGMRFLPHILTLTAGDTVRFLNHDSLAHSVYSSDGEGYNLGMFKEGDERAHTFRKEGVYAQLCNIHPEMLAYLFVCQNPFLAKVDKNGGYEINDVPPGKYTLRVWNSHLATAGKPVTVGAGKTVEESFSLKR
jgi:plastocyanin